MPNFGSFKTFSFQEKIKPNAFRLILHDGSFVHLCGFSHHDSAKWVSDLRAEIENAQLKEEQEFEVLSGDLNFFLHIFLIRFQPIRSIPDLSSLGNLKDNFSRFLRKRDYRVKISDVLIVRHR